MRFAPGGVTAVGRSEGRTNGRQDEAYVWSATSPHGTSVSHPTKQPKHQSCTYVYDSVKCSVRNLATLDVSERFNNT